MFTRFRTWTCLSILIVLVVGLFLTFTGIALADEPALVEPGVPSRLVISSIDLDSHIIPVGWKPVVVDGKTYGQWETAVDLVGWHNLSARLGSVGNTVLAGHSDVHAQVFKRLEEVNLNDVIVVFSGEQAHQYLISEKFLVKEKGASLEERINNARWITTTEDERLTLITCALPGATHRLIIIAQPVPAADQ
jgi:sortase A